MPRKCSRRYPMADISKKSLSISSQLQNVIALPLTPLRSQSRNVLNEPTANISPSGVQATDVIG